MPTRKTNLLFLRTFPLIFLFLAFLHIQIVNSCTDNGTWAELLASPPSDLPTYILGGIFGIHEAATDLDDQDDVVTLKCDCTYQESVFLVEAMIYAIQQINYSKDLLANVQLGYNIQGSCDTASEDAYFALEEYSLLEMQIMNITNFPTVDVGDDFKETPVAAIIGPCSADGSMSIANVLSSFGIPIISYGATVGEMCKRSRFPTLFRTTFSDDKQAEALADLCHSFNWTYVAAVGSDDDLGHEGVESFKQVMTDQGLCLSSEAYFDDESDESNLFDIIENLKQKDKDGAVVNVVLLFMEWRYASTFLKQANSQQLVNMTWLGVDHWTGDVGMTYWMPDDYLPAPYTKGTVSTQFTSAYIRPFADYMEQNLPERIRENKWLMYFYCDQCNPKAGDASQNYTCSVEFATSNWCLEIVDLPAILRRQRRILNVFDAVYAAAYALDGTLKQKHARNETTMKDQAIDNAIRNRGPLLGVESSAEQQIYPTVTAQLTTQSAERGNNPKLSLVDYDHLIHSLASVNFTYNVASFQSPRISFRHDGDLNDASFEIVNFYQGDKHQCYLPSVSQRVGLWKEDEDSTNGTDDGTLSLDTSRIRWQTDLGTKVPPVSYCHRACNPGERLVDGPTRCCWSCEMCPQGTFSDDYNSPECKPCGLHTYSNEDNTACLPNRRVWIGYSDPVAISCIVLCGVGEILTFAAAVICCAAKYYKHSDGDYAMKTVVLVNFALAYTYVIAIFAQPTVQICTIRLIMWQSLATANLVAKFFMLPRGRRAAARLARTLGLVRPKVARVTISRTSSRSDSISSVGSSIDSASSSASSSFAYRWLGEVCYSVVLTAAVGTYVLVGVLAPPTVIEADLEHEEEEQATETMLDCAPNGIVAGLTFVILCAVWVLNLVTSSNLYRRARRRRCRSAFGGSILTASGQSISRMSAVEFHASNILWSGYLTVLILIVVVPLFVTTDDPWSRAVFRIYTPLTIITVLLGVFALPRCWHALKSIHYHTRAEEEDVFEPGPFVISTANDLHLRKMSTIPEDEASEL